MKRRPRRPRRFVLILLLLAFAWLPGSGAAAPSVAGGAADVRLLVSTIESQHPSPFHGISKEALDAAGEALAARAEGMHRDRLIVELMRLVASLGERDGHSGIYPGDEHSPRLHLYPLKLYDFSDGLVVIGERGIAGALGARVVAIEGRPIAEVVAMVRPLIARDNEWQRRLLAPSSSSPRKCCTASASRRAPSARPSRSSPLRAAATSSWRRCPPPRTARSSASRGR